MERMAAADAAHTAPAPDDHSVLLHRFDKIPAARWVKPALPPDNRTERELVASDEADHELRWQAADGVQELHVMSAVRVSRIASRAWWFVNSRRR
jgi:hypothetical protein